MITRRQLAVTGTSFGLLCGLAACGGPSEPDGGDGPGHPVAVQIVAGNEQTGAAGEPLGLAIQVRVLDSAAIAVPAVTVAFSPTVGGGSFEPPFVTTSASGMATARWTLGPAPGLNLGEVRVGTAASVTITATGVVGPPAILRLTAGGDQTGVTDWPVPLAPAVVLQDAHGNPVANVPVTFGVAPTDGWVRGGRQTTDSLGRAQLEGWVLPRRTGLATLRIGTSGPPIINVSATAVGFRPVAALAAARGMFTCGLRPEGEAFCFGTNEHGQRGDSVLMDVTDPLPVGGQRRFSIIAPGGEHTCGLTPGGQAFCWGLNVAGQLGDGTTEFRRFGPTPVAGGRTYSRIAAGGAFTCALDAAGGPYCWGAINGSGVPAAVTVPVPLVQLAAGGAHACGLSADGTAYCWGVNGKGQLGDGTRDNSASAVAVGGGLTFSAIAAGLEHTCVLGPDGTPYCWGGNRVGQVGDGTVNERLTPTAAAGSVKFAAISAGGEVSCALTAAGAAYCCGDNGSGAVGVGSYGGLHATLEPVTGGHEFTAVSVGGSALSHVCAVTAGSDVYCWGSNSAGQLGNRDPVSRHTPTRAEQ